MTDSRKKFFGKLAIIWAVVIFLAAIFFGCILPDMAVIPIILGIGSYLVVAAFLLVLDWLMDN